jgi:hypothetical protein
VKDLRNLFRPSGKLAPREVEPSEEELGDIFIEMDVVRFERRARAARGEEHLHWWPSTRSERKWLKGAIRDRIMRGLGPNDPP